MTTTEDARDRVVVSALPHARRALPAMSSACSSAPLNVGSTGSWLASGMAASATLTFRLDRLAADAARAAVVQLDAAQR